MAYLSPADEEEAFALLHTQRPVILAGGTDLFAAHQHGFGDRAVLDVTRLPALGGIGESEAGWRIGATARWTDVLRANLPPAFDALKQAAREVGAVQIQNRGTIAGNLCNASPAADGVPPLLALGAEVEIGSLSGRRRVPLGAFIQGPRRVDIGHFEMVTAIHVPRPATGTCSAFLKLGARRYQVISIAMVAVTLRLVGGAIAEVAVAVGACSPVARRLPALEAALVGLDRAGVEALEIAPEHHLAALTPIDDVRGSAAYRSEAVATLCRRAVLRAMSAGRSAPLPQGACGG